MDDRNFDDLTRSLAGPTRRGIVAAVGAAILAVLGGTDASEALAKPKDSRKDDRRQEPASVHASGKGKKKKRKKKSAPIAGPSSPPCTPNCSGKICGPDGCGGLCGPGCGPCRTCTDAGTCSLSCGGNGCCDGFQCQPGDTNDACGTEGIDCKRCVAPQTCGGRGTAGVCGCTPKCHGKNCGPNGCGGICGACNGGLCANGVCGCPVGMTLCDGTCVDLKTDETNCGSCGTACKANEVCQANLSGASCLAQGICSGFTQTSACAPSFLQCSQDPCYCAKSAEGNTVCVDFRQIVCANTCSSSTSCPSGYACVDIGGCCTGLPAGTKTCMPDCFSPII